MFNRSKFKLSYVFVLSVPLLLASCATRTGSVTQPAAKPQAQQDAEAAVVTAYIPPTTATYARPKPGKAVQVLASRANDQYQAGNFVAAAGTLERALRIEPKNPFLWNKLAHVRLQQKQYKRAAGLAARSNSYASAQDGTLKKDNQAVIKLSR